MKRRDESGFALLLVFLMSASIATMLYMQLPRAAFEAQRGKEELLQHRGEEYIRSIQLYVTKWRRYPQSLDDLERTNNIRYLRRRYKDPMTGKDEWRAVHVDSAGQLTDSVVQKQTNQQKKEAVAVFVSELPTVGATTGTGGQAGQNVALRRRPSDSAGATDPNANSPYPVFDPNTPVNISQMTGNNNAAGQNGQPQQPQQPGVGVPGQAPPPTGAQEVPAGQPDPNQPQPQPGVNPQFQGQQPQPQQPQIPGQPVGMPGMPNANPTNIPPGVPGVPQQPNPQGQPGAATPNAGLDMINRILTTPRASVGGQVPGAPGLQIGGGIAGFASTMEAPSIKVYNDRQKYNEWEFIYDMRKDKRLTGAANAAAAGAMNSNPLGGSAPTGTAPGGMSPQQIPNPLTNPGQQTTNPNSFGGMQGPQSPNYAQPGRR